MIHNHRFRITCHDSQPLAQHNTPRITQTGSVYHIMINNHWLIIAHHHSQPLSQYFCWTSGLESWCVMLSKWLWLMVCNAEQVVVSHGELCWAHMIHNHWVSITHHDSQPLAQHYTPWLTATRISIAQHDSPSHAQHNTPWFTPLAQHTNSCESCCFILCRLCLSYGVSCRAVGYEWYESVVVNYGAFCWTSGLESWCVMLSQWLWFMVHWLNITHYDSQPLAQHNSTWLTTTCSALHTINHNHLLSITHHVSQRLWIMVCYSEPVVVNHGVLCWASGCESWCALLNQLLWYNMPLFTTFGTA
jgi:hypothetical protein